MGKAIPAGLPVLEGERLKSRVSGFPFVFVFLPIPLKKSKSEEIKIRKGFREEFLNVTHDML